MVVAGSAALLLALGSGPLTIATAGAAPGPNSNYPLATDPGTPGQQSGQQPKKDDKVDKAEKLGGGITTKVIDLASGVVKCGLNIAMPTVKCEF
ncbi:hypothetical protein [Nocardia jejuensis]|uniref:hypothetical protein n=1 Tax=Nocardia jejuensis TaxID=328049 RepID=UPI000833ED05|nr:hypothetical protein [Nocardia jejuensis]